MKDRRPYSKVYGVTALMLLVVTVSFTWYIATARIADLDSMIYCACGYSKVQFKDGRITMVKYHHDTVKPGELIGRYSVTNHQVDLEVYFEGKTNVTRCRIDNVGVLAPSGSLWEYDALNSRSLKPWVHHYARKIF
jgi:hypothetical protein